MFFIYLFFLGERGRNLLVNAEITGDPHNERRKWMDYFCSIQIESNNKGLTVDSSLIKGVLTAHNVVDGKPTALLGRCGWLEEAERLFARFFINGRGADTAVAFRVGGDG